MVTTPYNVDKEFIGVKNLPLLKIMSIYCIVFIKVILLMSNTLRDVISLHFD